MEGIFERVEVDASRQKVHWSCLSWMEVWRSLMMADVVQKNERLTWENIEAVTRLTKGVESESLLKTGNMETRSLFGFS